MQNIYNLLNCGFLIKHFLNFIIDNILCVSESLIERKQGYAAVMAIEMRSSRRPDSGNGIVRKREKEESLKQNFKYSD